MPSCDNSTPVLELTNLIGRDMGRQEQDKPVQQPEDVQQTDCAACQDQAVQPGTASDDAAGPGVLQGQAVICDKISENTASQSGMACYIEETINKVTMQVHECMRMEAAQKFKELSARMDSLENVLDQKKAFDMRTQESLQACQNQLNLATTRLNSLNKEVQRLLAMSPENNEAESRADEGAVRQEMTERVREEVSGACSDLEGSLSKLNMEIIRLAAKDSARKARLDQLEAQLKEYSERQNAMIQRLDRMDAMQAALEKGQAEGTAIPGSLSSDLDDIQGQLEENEIKTSDLSLRIEALADSLDQQEQKGTQQALHISEMTARIEQCEASLSDDALEQLAAKACARILREEIRLLKEQGR